MSTGVGNEITQLQPDLLEMQDVHAGGYDDQQQATNEGSINSSCSTQGVVTEGFIFSAQFPLSVTNKTHFKPSSQRKHY